MNKKVVKDNALIEASYRLGVVEQRLIFLAIIEAREKDTPIEAGGILRIHADSYMQHFNVERHTAYEVLKQACNGLFEQYFSYSKIDERTGKIGHYKSRWVDKIGYIEGLACVEMVFASDVIPLITRLEQRYTEYELRQVSGLQSSYAIRLYELIVKWRSVGRVPMIEVVDFREQMGVAANEYSAMSDFKKRVLDLAVSQINEHTDITAQYEQHKEGRSITGFSFAFKQKEKPVQVETLAKPKFIKMTDKQLGVYSKQLAEMGEVGSTFAQTGESMADFTVRIKQMLEDEEVQVKLMPYLEIAGFKQR